MKGVIKYLDGSEESIDFDRVAIPKGANGKINYKTGCNSDPEELIDYVINVIKSQEPIIILKPIKDEDTPSLDLSERLEKIINTNNVKSISDINH